MALLLLADESETQVRSYIQLGDLYVFSTGERPDETAGIVLTTPQQPGVVELKAVAVEPRFQRQGIGLHMISGVRQNLQGMKVQKEEKYFILGNIAAASGLLSMWESSNVFFGRRVESDTFEAMALPHLNDLYRTAVHFVRDRTEAHDLVQEAYLQAWKAFHRFEPGTNCRAWLFKILINEIRHYRRRSTPKPCRKRNSRSKRLWHSSRLLQKTFKTRTCWLHLTKFRGNSGRLCCCRTCRSFHTKKLRRCWVFPWGQ